MVSVYANASACKGARRVLGGEEGKAGDVRVRVICLTDAERGGHLDLAMLGANARRATEDSTTVAYIGEQSREAVRFSRPIVEEAAGIAEISGLSTPAAMNRIINAIRDAGASSDLRESVLNDLH